MGEMKAAILSVVEHGETVTRAQMLERLPQYPPAVVGSSLSEVLQRVGKGIYQKHDKDA